MNLDSVIEKIRRARHLILSTHRHCDGDGLGAQLALYHALRKTKKEARLLNVDKTPKKYSFLAGFDDIQFFEGAFDPITPVDLALIFDTNDRRLLGPLYQELKRYAKEIVFVDHHPILSQGPEPTPGSIIEPSAASTGEIVYNIIKKLNVELNNDIAQALYTSIAFDTHLFRYIRNSSASHAIAAELLKHRINTEQIHRHLFGNQTVHKTAFMSKALGSIEYHDNHKIAFLKVSLKDLMAHGLEIDETRDIVDMILNIETIEAAVVFREDGPRQFKLSIRSKGKIEVHGVAESLGGGGHLFSAGAYLKGDYEELKNQTINLLSHRLKAAS
ncbi:MAG TPA: DHH family phosphoesterase [Bdellovibrionales bacterium]|nr:DHH family phosphoesterase [Bdellovibrionales bacterium]